MNIHYNNYLVRKYPLLYRNRYASPKTTAMVWGFSCGNGWFNIINALSAELSYPYERAKSRYEFMVENKKSPELISEAVNEMNLLREHHPVAMQVKEKFGSLRFYADNISADQENTSLSQKICPKGPVKYAESAGSFVRAGGSEPYAMNTISTEEITNENSTIKNRRPGR